MRLRLAGVVIVLGLASLVAGGAAPAASGEPDCDGPPAAAQPGTAQWDQREADNVYCGQQRSDDTSNNPAYASAATLLQAEHGGPTPEDPFRDPAHLAGSRFRFELVSFTNQSGERRAAMLFRPCDASCHDRPPGLRAYDPPYPGVIVVHGGSASQEMYLWGAEALAEAGYMVLSFQIPEPENSGGDFHYPDTKAALDYILATPQGRAAGGDFNSRWTELDRDHIGLAGHSAGGVAVSRLGQEDPRVSAIVSWDRAQSGTMPPDLRLRTPALFMVADFNCQRVPVCLPQPYPSPPDPLGPGNKDEDFQRVSAAGIDTMKVALRATTHLDFTQFAPTPPSSRYGAIVSSYYTLAWFDRYLKGGFPATRAGARGRTLGDDALARLTATTFDGSADLHYISGGTFDSRTQRNVPAHIAGRPVADRFSFHFQSAYFFGRGRIRCDDMRAGCPPVAASTGGGAAAACRNPEFRPKTAPVRRGGRTKVRPRVLCFGRRRSVLVRLRAGKRSVYTIAGRLATLRVPASQRRVPASFTVDGRRYTASIALVRARRSRARFTG